MTRQAMTLGAAVIGMTAAMLVVPSQAAAQDGRPETPGAQSHWLYEQGQAAIERAQWTQAVERFSTLASVKAPRADAALYWRAYALDRLNRQADALTTVAELTRTYPKSRWVLDARALEIQVRQRAGQPVSPDTVANEDLKLIAIQGLQRSEPDQAVPMLEKVLTDSQSSRVKERALFVLAQSTAPRARQVLTTVARGQGSPDLQLKAIQYISMRGPANRDLLGSIYTASTDLDVKRQILRSFTMTGDRQRVTAAAAGESSPELRGEAVRQLGRMGAREEIWQLFQKEPDLGVKEEMVQAMFMSRDVPRLIDVASSEANTELRRRALKHLGMMGTELTGSTITAIYARERQPDMKATAIDALFVQQNGEALVTLARKEGNPELKQRIVQRLSLMRDPSAKDYLMKLPK